MINTIQNGDCLEIMRQVADNSVDLIICDPPYGSTSLSWDSVIPFDKLWLEYKRICKRGSTICLFGSGLFTAKLILSNEKDYKYSLIWKKSKCGSPLLAKYRPMMKHEDIAIFVNGGGKSKTYKPQFTVGKPYSRHNVETKVNNHGYGIKTVNSNNLGTRHPTSILDFPMKWRRQDQVHPTQKPIELMEWLIKSYSSEGELVLDSCAGSGPVLIAAKNLKRQFIGIEKDPEFYQVIQNRLNNLENV